MYKINVVLNEKKTGGVITGENIPSINVESHATKTMLSYKNDSNHQITITAFNHITDSRGNEYSFHRHFFGKQKYSLRNKNLAFGLYRQKGNKVFDSTKYFIIRQNGNAIGNLKIIVHLTRGEEVAVEFEDETLFEPCLIFAFCVFKALLGVALSSHDLS